MVTWGFSINIRFFLSRWAIEPHMYSFTIAIIPAQNWEPKKAKKRAIQLHMSCEKQYGSMNSNGTLEPTRLLRFFYVIRLVIYGSSTNKIFERIMMCEHVVHLYLFLFLSISRFLSIAPFPPPLHVCLFCFHAQTQANRFSWSLPKTKDFWWRSFIGPHFLLFQHHHLPPSSHFRCHLIVIFPRFSNCFVLSHGNIFFFFLPVMASLVQFWR